MESYSHLSLHERIRIEKLRFERRLTIRGIAAMIGRSPSTVSRETKRGLWLASNENESHRPYKPKRLKTGPWTAGPSYSALAAQRKAEQRAGRSRRPMRMDSNRLRAWVLNALRRGWTPQLIDGGPKAGFPDDPAMRVGHECLYQWIRAKGQRALDLRQYPPRGVGSATSNPTPPSARLRRNDASTRRSSARAASCSPDSSRTRAPWGPRVEYDIYRDIPPTARIDRTRDNGTESSRHPLVDEDLQAIIEEINDAPMKILGYETPNEAWQREIERSCSSPDPTAGVVLAK